MNHLAPLCFVRNGMWAISNLCRGKPPASFDKVRCGRSQPCLWLRRYHRDCGSLRPCTCAGGAPAANACGGHLLGRQGGACGEEGEDGGTVRTPPPPLCLCLCLSLPPPRQILIDALWTLSYMSDGDNVRVETCLEAGITQRVVQLLVHSESAVQV